MLIESTLACLSLTQFNIISLYVNSVVFWFLLGRLYSVEYFGIPHISLHTSKMFHS